MVKREAPPSKEETHVAPPSRPPVAQPRSNVSQPLNIQPLEPTPAVSPAQTTVAGVHRPAPIHKPPAVPETRKQEDHQSTFVPAVTHQPQVVIPQGNAGVYPRPDYPGSDRIMASVPKQVKPFLAVILTEEERYRFGHFGHSDFGHSDSVTNNKIYASLNFQSYGLS